MYKNKQQQSISLNRWKIYINKIYIYIINVLKICFKCV